MKMCLMQAIGVRLEEILVEEALCNEEYTNQGIDELRQRALQEEDENEDFLVEGTFKYLSIDRK